MLIMTRLGLIAGNAVTVSECTLKISICRFANAMKGTVIAHAMLNVTARPRYTGVGSLIVLFAALSLVNCAKRHLV